MLHLEREDQILGIPRESLIRERHNIASGSREVPHHPRARPVSRRVLVQPSQKGNYDFDVTRGGR
jgi:hypothetical protein